MNRISCGPIPDEEGGGSEYCLGRYRCPNSEGADCRVIREDMKISMIDTKHNISLGNAVACWTSRGPVFCAYLLQFYRRRCLSCKLTSALLFSNCSTTHHVDEWLSTSPYAFVILRSYELFWLATRDRFEVSFRQSRVRLKLACH
jgi:hypothetical protein